MASFNTSGTLSATQTLSASDTGTIGVGGLLTVGATDILWNFAATGTVMVDNSGTIRATSARAFETSASAATAKVGFQLTNRAGATITAATDVMRVQAGIGGGTIGIANAGTITAGTASTSSKLYRAFNIQDYTGVGAFTVSNAATGIITSTDDTLRLTTGTAGADATANPAFIGAATVDNFGTIRSTGVAGTGAGSGQAIDYSDLNSTVVGGVGITNEATGVITASDNDAIRPGNNGTVYNYGVINGSNVAPAKSVTVQAGAAGVEAGVNETITVFNYAGATITGAKSGVFGSRGTITTSGTVTIDTQHSTVLVTNMGTIIGRDGKAVGADYGTIVNSGVINGTADTTNYARGDGDGVDINYTGSVSNLAGGTIEGTGAIGVDDNGRTNISDGLALGGGTVDNAGLILSYGNGVTVNNDSNTDQSRSGNVALSLTNEATGVIQANGGYAIRSENKAGAQETAANVDADTVTNYGTIVSTGTIPNFATPVTLRDPTTGNTIADPNTVGTVDGVAYTTANAGSARFILGDGSAIQLGEGNDVLSNYGAISASDGLAINLEGGDDTLNLYTGESISGTIDGGTGSDTLNLGLGGVGAGTLTSVVNFETLNLAGGSWTIADAESYSGGINLTAGRLELGVAPAAGSGTITFAPAGTATLQIDGTTMPSSTISGFQSGNAIDLRGLGFVAGSSSAVLAGGALTVSNGSNSLVLAFANSSVSNFTLADDGAGGTTLACFLDGTRIATERGEMAVEALQVGDRLVTASGALCALRWLGHRAVAGERPVRIRAGAFGPGRPARDLYLSPDHAVLVEDVLVPALHLINGCSIDWADATTGRYWHVLLDRHEVILAERLPCESLLEVEPQHRFDNQASAPDSLAFLAPFAPRISQGTMIAAIRAKLVETVSG